MRVAIDHVNAHKKEEGSAVSYRFNRISENVFDDNNILLEKLYFWAVRQEPCRSGVIKERESECWMNIGNHVDNNQPTATLTPFSAQPVTLFPSGRH